MGTSIGANGEIKGLGLLIPTINNISGEGDHKDRFCLNPAMNTNHQLQMYHAIGVLMGCAMRTNTPLSLDLPKLFWKLISR